MATTNHDRVGKALDLLRKGLAPIVEREFKMELLRVRFDEQERSEKRTRIRNGIMWTSAVRKRSER